MRRERPFHDLGKAVGYRNAWCVGPSSHGRTPHVGSVVRRGGIAWIQLLRSRSGSWDLAGVLRPWIRMPMPTTFRPRYEVAGTGVGARWGAYGLSP